MYMYTHLVIWNASCLVISKYFASCHIIVIASCLVISKYFVLLHPCSHLMFHVLNNQQSSSCSIHPCPTSSAHTLPHHALSCMCAMCLIALSCMCAITLILSSPSLSACASCISKHEWFETTAAHSAFGADSSLCTHVCERVRAPSSNRETATGKAGSDRI